MSAVWTKYLSSKVSLPEFIIVRILARSAALDILYGLSLVPLPDHCAHAVAVVSSITSSSMAAARLVAPSPLDKGAKKFFFSIVIVYCRFFSLGWPDGLFLPLF